MLPQQDEKRRFGPHRRPKPDANASHAAPRATSPAKPAPSLTSLDNGGATSGEPLSFSWNFWYDNPKKNSGQAYLNKQGYLKELHRGNPFQTLSGFYAAWNEVCSICNLNNSPDTNLHLFREGITPTWEDSKNRKGGKWMVVVPSALTREEVLEYWTSFMISVLLNDFELGEDVCGLVFCPRKWGNCFTLWNRSSKNMEQIETITKKMQQYFKVEDVKYKPHAVTLKKYHTEKKNQSSNLRPRAASLNLSATKETDAAKRRGGRKCTSLETNTQVLQELLDKESQGIRPSAPAPAPPSLRSRQEGSQNGRRASSGNEEKGLKKVQSSGDMNRMGGQFNNSRHGEGQPNRPGNQTNRSEGKTSLEGPVNNRPGAKPSVKPEGPVNNNKPGVRPEGPVNNRPGAKPSVKPEGPVNNRPGIRPEGPVNNRPGAKPSTRPNGQLNSQQVKEPAKGFPSTEREGLLQKDNRTGGEADLKDLEEAEQGGLDEPLPIRKAVGLAVLASVGVLSGAVSLYNVG